MLKSCVIYSRYIMSTTSWWQWMTFVILRSRRVLGDPSCVTEIVRGSSLLNGASKMDSHSAPHQVCSVTFWHEAITVVTFRMLSCLLSNLPNFHLLLVFILSCTGYQGPDFDWADYLKQCEAEAAPQHCFPSVSQPWLHHLSFKNLPADYRPENND